MSLKFFLTATILFGLFSCKKEPELPSIDLPKQEEIKQIEKSYSGGMLGLSETITITKDSIIHSHFSAHNNEEKIFKGKNTDQDWKNLISSFKISDFKKIKSGESVQLVDGVDEKIDIETNLSSYSIVNGYDDTTHYHKIENLVKRLDKMMLETKP